MSKKKTKIVNLDNPNSNKNEEYSTPIILQGMRRGKVAKLRFRLDIGGQQLDIGDIDIEIPEPPDVPTGGDRETIIPPLKLSRGE